MRVQLICQTERRSELEEKLIAMGMTIDDKADYMFIDKSYNAQKFILAKDEDKNISLLEYDKILYFESFDKITEVVTVEKRLIVNEKLYELEERFVLTDFVRVNKSTIVNLLQVEQIIPWIGSKFVLDMKNGDQVDVTRTYFSDFKKRLGI